MMQVEMLIIDPTNDAGRQAGAGLCKGLAENFGIEHVDPFMCGVLTGVLSGLCAASGPARAAEVFQALTNVARRLAAEEAQARRNMQ